MKQERTRGPGLGLTGAGLIGAWLLFSCSAALGQTGRGPDANLEYSVKAAFLLNFTKFIEWPPGSFIDAQSPMEICILGKDPFGRTLDDLLQGENAGGRLLVARRIDQPPTARTCHVLYIGAFSREDSKDLPQMLGGLPQGILTVGEGDRFTHAGGMIALVVDERRVRFDINQSAAQRGGLKLSSRLLAVARALSH